MSLGKIKLMEYQDTYIEQKAYDYILSQDTDWTWKGKSRQDWLDYFTANIPEQKVWSDYAIYLINSYPRKWVREEWRKKVEKSIKHWSSTGSCVPEAIRDALLILSDSKDTDYLEYKEAFTKGVWWDEVGYTEISRMPIVKLFKYGQESPENQVSFYVKAMVEDIKSKDPVRIEKAMAEIKANTTLNNILFGVDGAMDDIKELPASLQYLTTPWCSQRDLVNIPSSKDIRLRALNSKDAKKCPERARKSCDVSQLVTALENGIRRYFHDSVKDSGNWKRIVIACLRGDVSFTYLCFSPSTEQKMMREQGMAAFSHDEGERSEALKKFEKLKVDRAKEIKEEESTLLEEETD